MQTLFGQDEKLPRPDESKSFACWTVSYYLDDLWTPTTALAADLAIPGSLDGVAYLAEQDLVIDSTYLLLSSRYFAGSSIKRMRYIDDAFHGSRFLVKAVLWGAYYGIKFGFWIAALVLAEEFIRRRSLPFNFFWLLPAACIAGSALIAFLNLLRALPRFRPHKFGVVMLELDDGKLESFAIRTGDARRILQAFERLGCAVQAFAPSDNAVARKLAKWNGSRLR